jgi:2-polyprenyl-6-methoxyphenol hydroxylase-like FAD-dependent oxidoreductase
MCAPLSAAQTQPEFVLHNFSNLWQPALPPALFYRTVCKHAGANNVQRGWDATPPPPGVLAIGDGVQALNPVYAQGMSVAAKSAECLGRVMQASIAGKASPEARRQAVRGMGPSFQKQLAAVIAPAWMMATSEDQRCVWLWAVRMVVLTMHAATLVPSPTMAGCWVC